MTREQAARHAAEGYVRRAIRNAYGADAAEESVVVEPHADVTFLDEQGTGVEGWAYVEVRVLVPRDRIERWRWTA